MAETFDQFIRRRGCEIENEFGLIISPHEITSLLLLEWKRIMKLKGDNLKNSDIPPVSPHRKMWGEIGGLSAFEMSEAFDQDFRNDRTESRLFPGFAEIIEKNTGEENELSVAILLQEFIYSKKDNCMRLDQDLGHFFSLHPSAKQIIESSGGLRKFCSHFYRHLKYFLLDNKHHHIRAIKSLKSDQGKEYFIMDMLSVENSLIAQQLKGYMDELDQVQMDKSCITNFFEEYPDAKALIGSLGGMSAFLSRNSDVFMQIESIDQISGKKINSWRILNKPGLEQTWCHQIDTSGLNQVSSSSSEFQFKAFDESLYTKILDMSQLTAEQIQNAELWAQEINENSNCTKKFLSDDFCLDLSDPVVASINCVESERINTEEDDIVAMKLYR